MTSSVCWGIVHRSKSFRNSCCRFVSPPTPSTTTQKEQGNGWNNSRQLQRCSVRSSNGDCLAMRSSSGKWLSWSPFDGNSRLHLVFIRKHHRTIQECEISYSIRQNAISGYIWIDVECLWISAWVRYWMKSRSLYASPILEGEWIVLHALMNKVHVIFCEWFVHHWKWLDFIIWP